MVISKEEKAVLLERLQKAREVKQAKAAAKKKETPASVKEPEPPAPAPVAVAPVVAPAPAPEPVVPTPDPPAEPVVPEVPDLVAMSRKKPAKKKCLPVSSDEDSDEEEAELPPKKGKGKGGKKQAYMKIKIYKEPKNAAAFQSLVEAIQDEQPDPEPEYSPPASTSASIGRGCKFDIKNKTKPEGRSLPTPQELMRRAALEFFS